MRRFLLLFAALPALAQEPLTILERRELPVAQSTAAQTLKLTLTLATLEGAGWAPADIGSALRQSAQILAQCGVALAKAELVRIGAPRRFHDFHTPASRELTRELPLAKPAIYFVAGTRQRPAFEAEAIGRGNSRSRPELADTVWVTRSARDLGIVLAHELAHVLMDSGEHVEEPGNLMREDTAPGNVQLTEAQCARLRDTGLANGLLH
jgi:hypothetical protein